MNEMIQLRKKKNNKIKSLKRQNNSNKRDSTHFHWKFNQNDDSIW